MFNRRRTHRRQHVVLRMRQRKALGQRLRKLLFLAGLAGGAVGVYVFLWHGNPFLLRWLQRHTPELLVQTPPRLAQEPIANCFPAQRVWLWLPESGWRAERRILRQYPEIAAVRFKKDFSANRVTVALEPRKALVRWNNSGVDREGVVFPLELSDAALPKAAIIQPSWPKLGPWIEALSRSANVWPLVTSVSENSYGDLQLDLKTGARVVWGAPEARTATEKVQVLGRILQDAHQRLGGVASADLRFFDEGRIVVRPKSVS